MCPEGHEFCGCKLTFDNIRTLAAFFLSHPSVEGAYLENGVASEEARLGAQITFYVSRDACLHFSRRGDWQGEVDYLDKRDAEDKAWAAIWA